MAVNYEYYRIFYFVAKYHSFTQAAAILQNNQPNITRSMNNLEHDLGCHLFIRSNRGIRLTPEGEKLFAHVQIAQEQLQAGEYELANETSLKNGTVSIGASETALHGILLSELQKFHAAYPGIRIRISNLSTPQAIAALKTGSVELALVTTPISVEKPLRKIKLKSFREILIGGPQFSALSKSPLHLTDLKNYPLICLGRETKTYEFYNQMFLKYGLDLQPDMEAATTDQILPMVQHNLGIGFVPAGFAEKALADNEVFLLHLIEPIPIRYICLIKDEKRSLSVTAQELEKRLCSSI